MKLVDWVFAKLHKITDNTFVVRVRAALNERIKKPYNIMFEEDEYLVEILSENSNEQSLGIRFCLKNATTGVAEQPIFSFAFGDHTSIEGNLEEFENFIFTHAAVADLPPGDLDRIKIQTESSIKCDPPDLDSMNLYVGKIIGNDRTLKVEVVSWENNDFRIKILEIGWDRLGTYVDLGNTYSLSLCNHFDNFMVWEIDPNQMKRTASQVLLAWEKDVGWSWDLDS